MIITISGDIGAGKSTVARLVAKKLKYKHYSVGDFMRKIAKRHNLSLLKVSELAETDHKIDEELDAMQIELGKRKDKFVLDSRLGFHFIPKSFKVFLAVSVEEAGRRIFNDKRHGEHENTTLKTTIANIKQRKASEVHRYEKYYKLNPYDKKHYDLIIITTGSTPTKSTNKIITTIANE